MQPLRHSYTNHTLGDGATVVKRYQGPAMLRDGRADVAMLYGPREDLSGFATEELLAEDQVAVLPQRHRLAGREAVSLADLRGEAMPRWPHLPADGADGPEVHDAGQLMQIIALGQMVAVLPESVPGQLRHDLRRPVPKCRPILKCRSVPRCRPVPKCRLPGSTRRPSGPDDGPGAQAATRRAN